MNAQRQGDSKRRRLSLWFLAAMSVGLLGLLFWPARLTAPETMSAVSDGAAEHDAPERSLNAQDAQFVSSLDRSPDPRNLASQKLSLAEKAAISERMANVKNMLQALDGRNAKREMDHISDTHRVVADRIEAPTVEQLASIYDFLSKASKDFPEGSEGEAEFRKQAAAFLSEVGRSDFRLVVYSTNLVTGVSNLKVIRARAKSVAVKYGEGLIQIAGPHTTSASESPGNELSNLFPNR